MKIEKPCRKAFSAFWIRYHKPDMIIF